MDDVRRINNKISNRAGQIQNRDKDDQENDSKPNYTLILTHQHIKGHTWEADEYSD